MNHPDRAFPQRSRGFPRDPFPLTNDSTYPDTESRPLNLTQNSLDLGSEVTIPLQDVHTHSNTF